MKRVAVESTMISEAGYDPETEELEVVFNSGTVYRYSGVPREVYDGLLAADSKGSYMQAEVIDVFPYAQVSARRRRR
jgi:hypothetical protein